MEKETGDSINEVDKITQDTKPLKKHNKVAVIGGTICAVCALGTFYYFKVYDGGFHVSQSVDTYELSSEQRKIGIKYHAMSLLSYDIFKHRYTELQQLYESLNLKTNKKLVNKLNEER